MKLVKQISHHIEELCRQRQLTVSALSKKSGVSSSTIRRILRADGTQDVRIVTILRLCRGMDISLTEFWDFEQPQK